MIVDTAMPTQRTTISLSESRLLKVPTEIQHAIYMYLLPEHIHVYNRREKMYVSVCVTSNPNAEHKDEHIGLERQSSSNDGFSNRVWARRLRSDWGPHWQCQESILNEDPGTRLSLTLLLVCKTM
jgi:hypothetical protein